MQCICGPLILEFIREISSSSMFFCCSIYIETAQSSREECNEFADLLHFRLPLCLSRDSLSCDTRSLVFYSSLYFYTSNTFRPILARFSHILLYTIFYLMYITTRNIFLIPDDAVAWNLLIIFNFISQRPHLNYIFLSNVYSFDTMEFSMKHKC